MKAYHNKHNEILFNESSRDEDRLVDAYNKLFNELLLSRNISDKKIYQALNLQNNKITSTPHIVAALLKQANLPAFKFLICRN